MSADNAACWTRPPLVSSERSRPEQSEGPASPPPALTPAQRAAASARDLAPWFEDPIPHECPLCGSDKIIQRNCKVLCGTCRSIIQSCADL